MSSTRAAPSAAMAPAPPPPRKSVFKIVYRMVSSHVGLIVILVLYSFIGAAIFQVIEGPHETSVKSDIIAVRTDIIAELWNKTQTIGRRQALFEKTMIQELKRYEDELHTAFAGGINSDSDESVWDFWGSMFYCGTVYTTIGYGHIAPVTVAGRIATMIYSLIGIPLCLIVLADVGKLLTRVIKFPWAYIRRCYFKGECTQSSPDSAQGAANKAGSTEVLGVVIDDQFDEFNLPPIIAIFISVAYILLGAALYCQWEDWTYFEAFYFIFVSISTIGFGDVLPEHPKYFMASSIYVLLGLSLVAMVINVVMEVVSSTIQTASSQVQAVGKVMGLPILDEEEDEQIKRD